MSLGARPWTVHTGDCRVSLGAMEEESVDAIVTDTPYGLSTLLDPWNLGREKLWQKLTEGETELPIKTLMRAWLDTGENPVMKGRGFMGKEWDALVPPPNTWAAAWRVLKPGGALLAFGGSRTDDLIKMAIRFAGFEVDDQIATLLDTEALEPGNLAWLYGCLSEDTEIMVDGQWQHWTKAVAGSTVMAYSLEDGTLRPETVNELLVYEYDDTAFHIHGDGTDHIVSRNHRCVVRDNAGHWRFTVAERLTGTCTIPAVDVGRLLLSVRGDVREEHAAPEAGQDADVFEGVQRCRAWGGVCEACTQGSRCMVAASGGIACGQDVRAEESGVARRSDAAELEGELCGSAVHPSAARVPAHGSQGRLCAGASHAGGEGDRPHADDDRGSASHQPRPAGQQVGELDAVRMQCGPQDVRGAWSPLPCLATVTPIHYTGKVWCVRVPSGAFLARRNGQAFITGNSGMPKRVRLDLKIDQHFGKDKERPVLSEKPQSKNRTGSPTQFNNSAGDTWQTRGPATPEAARFVGYDRALRPGFEPIIVARKPCRGTIAATALRYGTGGFNVDGCRIPRGDGGPLKWDATRGMGYAADGGKQGVDNGPCGFSQDGRGGYPANVVIDEATARELDAQSGFLSGPGNTAASIRPARSEHVESVTWGSYKGGPSGLPLDKGGGASRFFYTAKASTSERDKGLEDLPELATGHKSGRDVVGDGVGAYQGDRGGGRNPHPTVKPLSLMRWLVRLASPPGAWDPDISKRPLIVDMFAGSGTTGVAGLVEGVRVVLCEMEAGSADVARRRCQHAYALPREEAGIERADDADLPRGQASLF